MPGYQPVRIMQPVDYFQKVEPIYGQIGVKSKKKSKGSHPLFDDIKSRDTRDRMDFERYRRGREVVFSDPSGGKVDSLKFIASCSDLSYLESYTNAQRQRHQCSTNETEPRLRHNRGLAKSASTVFGKGQDKDKRNSIHNDSNAITAAMLSSLRSASSEDNLYESMEMIHYLKTKQTLERQRKMRSVQKTGHPLFDSLREEQAMKEPYRKPATSKKLVDEHTLQGLRTHDYSTSDGNSPSQSSSSSGDENEIYPRVGGKLSKMPLAKMPQQQQQQIPHRRFSEPIRPATFPVFQMRQEKQKTPQKKKRSQNAGSDSDDDFKIIPRPRLVGKGLLMLPTQKPLRRRSDASPPSDESDSSFNSAILR